MNYKNNPEKCSHENIGKECYCGTKTGDYICFDCGETFSPDYFEIIPNKRKNIKKY